MAQGHAGCGSLIERVGRLGDDALPEFDGDFDDSPYPEYDPEDPYPWKSWSCFQCKGEFVDADEHGDQRVVPEGFKGIEAQIYWLGPNEVHCAACAIPRGIPPIQ
jgi:hypothetical protein